QKFSDCELDVIGSGDIEYFRTLAKKNDVERINFVGFCNPQEYYDRGAILCMTSSTEGLPMVLIEAQTNGVIPITYNSYASAADIIEDGENGFLVKAFNEDEYVEKLTLLMRDEELRLRMAESAMASVRKFDSRKIAQQWIDLFEKL
ncbi:MAG: glycosyltransferase, partial [Paludibacteraceae bacterium]|nr:glycosyltransferase [Paludibacteraceae bacterium]